MELAESFGQTMITVNLLLSIETFQLSVGRVLILNRRQMMRRGGIFGAPADSQALIPHESDTGKVLEAKWKKWTERESFKR